MMKKYFLLFSFVFLLFPAHTLLAQEKDQEVNLFFFWGEGCPHCSKEKQFLDKMEDKYPQLKVYDYEVWNNSANRKLLIDFGNQLNANISGVPFTVVGEKYVVGWLDENTTGKQIEQAITCSMGNDCRDIGAEIMNVDDSTKATENAEINSFKDGVLGETNPMPETIAFPIVGEIKTKHLSLPIFTILLGALDGFNPCAMWVLLFLITLLFGMKNKKRMWILGSTFIAASASVYFLFMAAWLNLLIFLGFIIWIRIIVGLVAIAAGGYNLKEYFTNKDATCKVTNTEKRQRIFAKLKLIVQQQNFYLALGGIILLAFAVNLVELLCSAGLPVIFTQVLTLSNLTSWQYYLYILLYIFVFILDDLFVFFIAMTTLQITGITTKYTRMSHLIGGILITILGLMLIFKPEWLMFG